MERTIMNLFNGMGFYAWGVLILITLIVIHNEIHEWTPGARYLSALCVRLNSNLRPFSSETLILRKVRWLYKKWHQSSVCDLSKFSRSRPSTYWRLLSIREELRRLLHETARIICAHRHNFEPRQSRKNLWSRNHSLLRISLPEFLTFPASIGADEGNRTPVVSLGSFCSAIELPPCSP